MASLARQLIGRHRKHKNSDLLSQIRNLCFRLSLIRHTRVYAF
ncbi:hypothetical protein LEP1GSC062_1827 [Leptospira alexanderi serovar Manhao 3 str. L 60]|uniref:Uncharacterized protein n=1 Tax=Leptospira alexanderi serovar Manhao 3 str. L 60 TaxID=1049759 RepID=V6IAN3_9LEPT|nr:hypothetical protein LEP1GSC062_1827 [Leptospira alexanderi serovar Manhao 3 str. L 60]